jgi:anti-sigma factor RsiW
MSDAASRLTADEMAELCALADGTLPVERRPAVEARVAASRELQELLERQRRAVAATQALTTEPVPMSLQTAVEASRRARSAPRSLPRWLVPRVAVAGALAVAIAVVAAVVFTGGPGAPTVAEAARFAAEAPTGPAPRATGDGARLAVDVEGVVFPDLLQSYGWRPVGVNRGEVDGRDATTVVYEKGGRRIAYVVVAGSGLPPPSAVDSTTQGGVQYQTLRVDGRLVVTWRRLGHTCVLVGAAPRSVLLRLASWRGNGTLRY